jgi:hypothetical protein
MVKFNAIGEEGATKQRVPRIDLVQIDPLTPAMNPRITTYANVEVPSQ